MGKMANRQSLAFSELGRAKGGGQTLEPREDGPSEAIFPDPPKAVSEVVS